MQGVKEYFEKQTARALEFTTKFYLKEGRLHSGEIDVLEVLAAAQAGIEWAPDKSKVGGPVDVVTLKRRGTIRWVVRKPNCTSEDLSSRP